MNATERLDLIRFKIERANEHIANLDRSIRAFFASKPYQVSTKRDPQTRRLIYFVSSIKQTPTSFSIITGDVVQNLRSALDHLAYQLFLVGTKGSADGRHVQFPIGFDAKNYAEQCDRRTVGMKKDMVDILNSLEPYRGGKGHKLWVLQELNNIDKHRLLVTVGSIFQSVNIGALMTSELRKVGVPMGMEVPKVDLYLKPQDKLFPLKVGDALFIDGPDAVENKEMDFRFNIALSEPNVIEDAALLDTLNDLCDFVGAAILQFKSYLT
jgi:hypothetical protein